MCYVIQKRFLMNICVLSAMLTGLPGVVAQALENNNGSATELVALFQSSNASDERAEALTSLAEGEILTSTLLHQALSDKDATVRLRALQLAEPFMLINTVDMDKVILLVDDEECAIRLEATRLLRYVWLDKRIAPLVRVYKRDGANPEFQTAILGSASGMALPLLKEFIRDVDLLANESYAPLIRALGSMCITSGEADYSKIVELMSSLGDNAEDSRKLLVSGFTAGAAEDAQFGLLKRLVSTEGATGTSMMQLIEESRTVAPDIAVPLPVRLQAITLLSADDFNNSGALLGALLAQSESIEIQSAALRSLSKMGDPQMVPLILEAWPQMGPAIRQQAMYAELRKDNYLIALLDAIDSGVIALDVIEPWGMRDLLQYPEIMVRTHARATLSKMSENGISESVQSSFHQIKELTPSLEHGKALFEENCSKCHLFNGVGNKVGPDLDVKAGTGTYTVLRKLLYPNEQVLTFYYSYTVETSDFEQFTGLIAAEEPGSILVRGPSGEEHEVSRDVIDSVTCSEKTLMPEGWKEALGEQGLADLIAYLVTTTQKAKVRPAS